MDCFIDNSMAIKPKDDKIDEMFDYIFENYIMSDSCFPLEMWAECSSSPSLTINGCESFHGKFNIAHPKNFEVIDTLTEVQSETQSKARSYNINILKPKKNSRLLETSLTNFYRMK